MANQSSTNSIWESPRFKEPISNAVKYKALKPADVETLNFNPSNFTVPKLVDAEQYIGIEVEIENVKVDPAPTIKKFWSMIDDGSLRNNGKEFVSIPVRGDTLRYAVQELYKYLNNIGATASPRTSVHVHLNMQNATIGQLINFLIIYIVYERVLYDFVGSNRDKNNFCIPLYSYPLTFQFLQRVLEGKMSDSVLLWLKYTGLNLKSLGKNSHDGGVGHGTVEFRHFSGSMDPNKVITWINFILCIRKAAFALSPVELVGTLNNNSIYSITNFIFGDLARLFDNKPINLMISEGLKDFSLFQHVATNQKFTFSNKSPLAKAIGK